MRSRGWLRGNQPGEGQGAQGSPGTEILSAITAQSNRHFMRISQIAEVVLCHRDRPLRDRGKSMTTWEIHGFAPNYASTSSEHQFRIRENSDEKYSCSASDETWSFSSNFLTAAGPATMRRGQTSLAESGLRGCSPLRRNRNCLAGGHEVQKPGQLQPRRRSEPELHVCCPRPRRQLVWDHAIRRRQHRLQRETGWLWHSLLHHPGRQADYAVQFLLCYELHRRRIPGWRADSGHRR